MILTEGIIKYLSTYYGVYDTIQIAEKIGV